jgi:hypothetical protein
MWMCGCELYGIIRSLEEVAWMGRWLVFPCGGLMGDGVVSCFCLLGSHIFTEVDSFTLF